MILLAALWLVTGGRANAQSAMDNLTIRDGVCQISTPADLANFALAVNEGNTALNAVVLQDLDFGSYNGEFSGIALDGVPYVGTFDGQGHRIKNLTIDGQGAYFTGLFRMVGDGCVIKNLTMDATCAIINGSNACAMVASNYNKADATITLIGLGNEGRVESTGQYVGAIAAINYSYRAHYIIQDCWSTGSVSGSTDVAQICGHLYHGTVNGCWSTATVTRNSGETKLFDVVNDATITNCFSLGGTDVPTFTEAELASGALCYKLNGDQSEIHWTQTIGTDKQPQLGTGSQRVYAAGELRCDGAEFPDKPLTYSNTESQPTQGTHQYGADGVCTVCGQMKTSEDGYYLIGNAEQLNWLNQRISDGETDLKVRLTADIDLSASEYPDLMIGAESTPFVGTFDGAGHTITYHYANVNAKWRGLFAFVKNATIRNLRVEGSVYVTQIHYGALIGRADGTVLVENVVTNVDITGAMNQVTGDAGMVGANYAKMTFNDCAVLGAMGYEGSSMYSYFSGWSDGNSSTTLNNCFSAGSLKEGTGTGNCFTLTHPNGTVKFNNCYYLNQIGEARGGTQMTEEQFRNGSVCFKLNGDQSEIHWTQTIGTDLVPQIGTGSQQVYASGELRCDGAEYPDKPLTYSNTPSQPTRPEHKYGADGLCTVCGQADPDAVKQNAEGYYLIGNAKQLNWLNQRILGGETQAKVLLTDDIDLSASDYPDLMIGTQSDPFGGIFDGQGHTITYHYALVTEKWRGLFAFVNNATIRNLRVEGSVTVRQIHYGALIGRGDGTILVENVVTNVDITGDMQQVTGDAGMIGANYAQITFNNCATLGTLGNPGSSMYSSFSGWSDGNSTTTLNNCYTTCQLTEGTGTGNCFTLTHSGGKVTLNNCYYLHTVGTVQGTQTSEDELFEGALCYKLNGDQSNIRWYQNLGEDEMPVPDKSHLRVFGAGDTYMNIRNEADLRSFISHVIDTDTEHYGEVKAQKTLVDSYLQALATLRNVADIDDFLEAYAGLEGQRKSINSCAAAYEAYINKVEETKRYLEEHPELSNEKSELLAIYLTEYEDPSEDFPHGSAPTILENCELSEEEIKAETALIDQKLVEAISFTPMVGTDITMLFTNPDFSDSFNGWQGTKATGAGASETSPIRAAECFNSTMDMYQTLTGLQNGIYELQVNGAYRPYPYSDYYNTNYAATLYANGIHNYFQTNIEDMISVDKAVDGENCHITGSIADFAVPGDDGETAGYTMQGVISCCNAFKAGRYPNSILCKVTDGSLTIGIRQPGSGQQPDWLGFGNIKVIYWGEIAEATESLDRVLESQSARAHTILEKYEFSYGTDFATYPNFSQALKDELQQTLDAVASTTDAEAKYQLIEKFSDLFLQIYDCKQAYITLMEKADEVNDMLGAFSNIMSDDEFTQMEKAYQQITDGYMLGTMTAEEARAIDPMSMISFFPDKEGDYYLLRSMKEYYVFVSLVNAGSTSLNAKLLTDIDLREADDPNLMIGNADARYSGIFDGQGHTITYNYDFSANYCGLFSYVRGATIRNLRVEGDVITRGIHYGALIGYGDGTILVEDVITNVNITGEHSGVTGNGGMIGALYGKITFNNCATQGIMGYPGSSMYCGYVAFASGDASSTLNNCYTSCLLTEGTGTDYCYTFCRGTFKANNCYYLNAVGTKQGTQVTEEQLQSGEVCYKLNGSQADIHWYQTLGEDALPVLDDTHKRVYKNEDGTYTNEKTDTPDGSKENPFVVKTAADLASLPSKFVAGQMVYVVMEADIDMAGVTDWKPLFNYPAATDEHPYPFVDFDGQNHVIRNLTSKTDGAYDYCGLFGVLCGNVRNLGVENADVTSTGGTGILGGYLGHSKYGKPCYVENVWVTGKLSATGYCGGMFGNVADESHILNCYANVEVTGESDLTGGIIGRVRGFVDMIQVYAAGSINRGGGIIGGGQQDATPLGSYKHIAVWNNTENNFGPTRADEDLRQIIYYDGSNFAAMQSEVVAWDPAVWSCDMAEGSYPVLKAFTTGVGSISAPALGGDIYDLSGRKLMIAPQKGIYILNGRKVLVK